MDVNPDVLQIRTVFESSLAAEAAPSPFPLVLLIVGVVSVAVVVVVLRVRRRGPRTTVRTIGAAVPAAAAVSGVGAPLAPGDPTRIGPYRLHSRLGGGGMGRVFLGSSPGGRTVAVKVVHPALADDPEFRRRFASEVQAARRVGGFHTAQVVDADPDGDPPWLATAYIPGPTLHQAVAGHGPLPPDSVAVLGAGLAEGLIAVHTGGVVHRDLKPANVILAADGPRLIDFGIARALDATSHTRTSTVLGTAAFMSPEQATAQTVGPASDVFSLGCVLAFAATGRSPFGEGSVPAVIYRVVHEEPDLSDLPEPLTALVAACLAKEPAARPAPQLLLDELAALSPPGPQRADGAQPDADTEVLTLHATRVLAPGTPPPDPPTNPAGNKPVMRVWRRMGGWKGAAAGLTLLALAPTAVVLYDGGTHRLSRWITYALDPSMREISLGDCATTDVDGSLIEVPCESADAQYRATHVVGPWASDGQGPTRPSDPSDSCVNGTEQSYRVIENPTTNVCLRRISAPSNPPQ